MNLENPVLQPPGLWMPDHVRHDESGTAGLQPRVNRSRAAAVTGLPPTPAFGHPSEEGKRRPFAAPAQNCRVPRGSRVGQVRAFCF